MNGRGGRPKSEIWKHVIQLGKKKVKCRHCEKVFANSANRIRSHIFHTKHNGISPCPMYPQPKTIDSSQRPIKTENNSNNIVNNVINSPGMTQQHWIEVNKDIEQHGRKQVGPFFVSNIFKFNESDLQLLQYVFNMSLTQSEIVVSSSHFYLNRSDFSTLKPQGLLVSSVIDIFVDYLTDIERKSKNTSLNWYLPLIFSTTALEDDKSSFLQLREFVKNQHIRENYMSSNLEDCEKIFIPIHIQGHYYLYVIHWKELQEVQILDSLPRFINKEVRDKTTEKLLLALDELFKEDLRGKRWAFKNFPVTNSEDILYQHNEYDCGIFVINFMQQSANYVNKIPSFQYHSDEERLDLALKLLKSDQNKERERLYDVAKQQYAHGRDEEGLDLAGIKRKRVDDTCKNFSKDVPIGEDTELDDSHKTFRNNVGMEKGYTKGYPLPTTDLVGQKFQKYKDQIWEWLMKDEESVIGLWGMGGVGKTALVTHIHNMLLQQDAAADYDHVIWITVSQQYSIGQLQKVIATSINLDISLECEVKRISGILLHAFKQMNKCAVILDDVWDYIPLEEVGFPILDDHPGIKLILTSRSWEVCQSMNCEDNIIKLEPLSNGDGWDLFKKTLGVYETLPTEVKYLGLPIACECSGLPLAIITVARSMKGKKDLREWKHMYERLQNLKGSGLYDMDKWVFPVLRPSYDRLTDTKLQEFFLYCAILRGRYGIGDEEDIMIPFSFGEKWIDEKKSLNEQFHECHILLVMLKNNSLLSEDGEGFEVDSLVRVMAIRILKEKHKILDCSDECLTEIPDEREWTEDLEKVFLLNHNIAEISEGIYPRCSKLSTLILNRNRNLKLIGDEFFMNMPALRVLDLSKTGIARLPNSISNLKCLVALLLANCKSLKYVPSLANLQGLIWLDLSYTAIIDAPKGLGLLINLRHLNLVGTLQLKMSTESVIPKLTQLQWLFLNCIAESMDVRAQDLTVLNKLESICVNFGYVQHFNAYMRSRLHCCGLKHYCFNLSKQKEFPSYIRKNLISGEDPMKMVRLVDMELRNISVIIPADVNQLYIRKCDHYSKVFLCNFLLFHNHRDIYTASRIEECDICECCNLEYLCCLSPSCKLCSFVQFVNRLHLYELNELRLLCMDNHRVATLAPISLPPPTTPFSHLRHLTIKRCNRMKKAVTPDMSAQLQNLEILNVESCASMEEIFSITSGEDDAQHVYIIRLPKLKSVWLDDLPQLNFVCKGTMLSHFPLRLSIAKGSCPKLEWPLQTENMMPNGCTLFDPDLAELFKNEE